MASIQETRLLQFEEHPKHDRRTSFWRQLFASSSVLTTSINSGMVFGFSATLLPELQNPESDIKISPNAASWVASAVPLAMVMGSLLSGPLMTRCGGKTVQFIIYLSRLLGWLAIYFAPNLITLLVGRAICGISVGLLATFLSLYIAEVSEPKYRGMLTSASMVNLSIGILLTHLLGTFLNWRWTALISTMFPLMSVLILFAIPEVPSYFILRNRHDDALKSFEWFRGSAAKSEFDEIWEYHKEAETKQGESSWSKLREAFQNPEFVKPSLIIFAFFFIMQFSGSYIVIFYSVTIMERTLGSSVDKYLIMNSIDVLRLVMSIVTSALLRISRRRVLMMTSGIGTALSMFVLAGFTFSFRFIGVASDYSWFLVTAFVSYIFFVSIGIYVLPWCMTGELLPLNYRSLGASLNVSLNYLMCFAIIKISLIMFEFCGMDGTFLLYGLVAFVGTTVFFFVTPETKNRTIVAIVRDFGANK